MIKSLKDLLDKFSRFTNSLVYDGGICKRLFKNKVIIIQGQVGTMNDKVSEKELLERFEKFKPVFSYVSNSLVINDLYIK